MKRILLLCIILICSSCQKEKAWRCYGDFESFDEGFMWEGKEYHEKKMIYIFGFNSRTLLLKSDGHDYWFKYQQNNFSPSPDGETIHLHITINDGIDHLIETLNKNGRIYFNHDPSLNHEGASLFDVVFNGYTICDGWISIIIGDELKKDIFKVPEVHFEFTVKSPEGIYSKIEQGYAYGRYD